MTTRLESSSGKVRDFARWWSHRALNRPRGTRSKSSPSLEYSAATGTTERFTNLMLRASLLFSLSPAVMTATLGGLASNTITDSWWLAR